ncbi:cytosolic phospholipase A2 beta-like [Podarcis lilfordi]|uniref:Cytosolic phospholipase A2 beta-like n=1 Tax=Podarcis lilfordi TaxID=74358 RepID=A0AA35JRU4_9SAUR|nr:cytosolic phospholipase A2 beta-like [Podarcis lilfordi]
MRRGLFEDEVPVIAVMATGGGVRAMSGFYGHLLALQKLNLLDCISYITTASGSTWTMTDLYRNTDWSHENLEEAIKVVKRSMLKSKIDIISIDRLKYYHKELVERVKRGHLRSFTALWALVQEAFLHDKFNDSKLSEQRQALDQGQNPLPIYTAVNVKDKVSTFDFREWVDFSPYEVGFQKYGVNIRAEDFDSEFFMGKLVKKIPESRICYLEGIWTNIFCVNLMDGLYTASTTEEFWDQWAKDLTKSEEHEGYFSIYKPPTCGPGKLGEIFNDILTDRPLKGETHNFLQSLDFHKDYLQQKEFLEWRDTVFDASPNKLTPVDKSLCLIDIGFFVNTSIPPLLKPERNVDVIIIVNYDVSSPFKQIRLTAKYCEEQSIPFPKVDLTEEDWKNPRECYVFSDEDNPQAPILIYFPLVCASFKEYKAPGVKRTPSEMRGCEVNLGKDSPYKTIHLTYSEEDFDKLLNLCTYNILCSEDHILQAIQRAIQKKKNIWSQARKKFCHPEQGTN